MTTTDHPAPPTDLVRAGLRDPAFQAYYDVEELVATPAEGVGGPRLRVVSEPRRVDPDAAQVAARAFLTALGIPPDAESMADTPRRMVDSFLEMLTPVPFDLTTFPNEGGYDQLVLATGIPVHSLCEHHMLPFMGVAHVGYLPGERILGLSKLARVVAMFSRGPQVQERLTSQVARWLQDNLAPSGVGVVIEAEHLCMAMRGVRAGGTRTITSALHGALRDDPRSRAEFLALTTPGNSTPTRW